MDIGTVGVSHVQAVTGFDGKALSSHFFNVRKFAYLANPVTELI